MRASYLELYNESVNDLLNPESTNLALRWQARTGAFVENLLQVECESVDDAMAVFSEGTRNRKVMAPHPRLTSSRCCGYSAVHSAIEPCNGHVTAM